MKVIKKLCRTMYNLLTSYSNILTQKYYWGGEAGWLKHGKDYLFLLELTLEG